MDTTELADLVSLHGKAVYGFCQKLAITEADTDDLYQETFLTAMQLCNRIDKYQNPKGFLIGISVRLWQNNRRKYARRQRIAPTEELDKSLNSRMQINGEPSPEDIVISSELCCLIQTAVDGLSDRLKIPLYMYYTAGMSTAEIASALKIPPGTVKSRLHKARQTLKRILEVNQYEKY